MKNTLFRSTIAAAVVAMLSACGGGDSDVGSSVVQISFDEPQGVLEAGRLVTVTGHAVSKSSKLATMTWTVAGAGTGASAPTVTNADCAQAIRSDSDFANGSSNWSCTLTLQAPKVLSEDTTYELGLSASSASFSGKGSKKVTIKPATVAANPVQVQIGALPAVIRAGEAINVSGTVSSNASKVTGARWTIVYTGSNSQASSFPLPTLENANCGDKVETVNPSGQESSTWSCPMRLIVSPRLESLANYRLTLVGTNANGFALSNSVDVPVSVAPPTSNKITVSLAAAPLSGRAGDKITIRGSIKSTDSKISLGSSRYVVQNITPVNAIIGVEDASIVLSPTNCVRLTVPTGTVKDEVSCSSTLTLPTTITQPITMTYALQGVDDEGAYNYTSADITVQPTSDAFGQRATVAYAPVPVVPGSPVNLSCTGQGTGPFTYSWRVVNSNGTVVNLSSATTTTGNASFNAPSPATDTDVVVECGVFNGSTVTYTPLTVRVPGSTSPLGFRADVNATPNPVKSGDTVNLTCQGLGVANATYSYTWRVTNHNGMAVNLVNGANGAASFVAPALVPPAGGGATVAAPVTLTCSVTDGTRVITQPLDVIINP